MRLVLNTEQMLCWLAALEHAQTRLANGTKLEQEYMAWCLLTLQYPELAQAEWLETSYVN